MGGFYQGYMPIVREINFVLTISSLKMIWQNSITGKPRTNSQKRIMKNSKKSMMRRLGQLFRTILMHDQYNHLIIRYFNITNQPFPFLLFPICHHQQVISFYYSFQLLLYCSIYCPIYSAYQV